ncbi:hypothetical protein H6G80_33690 [Nostoc sp. FACHB-87]|uniref:hypothetical protein n=1 Tax=Nostocales TaxID=1161 RepID=UPI001685ACDF|nr:MULTISPECIES: hypothetical protein [Nostocales]MBD2303390.1 hypothetical protein [Nostoc sp. FACHB-190]MBD2458991.1 hypothetical protein [Nostoc sp. FACHB-87]MBD2480002.1 hypothetical protein [Anabaena sp. FACHB-83]MBD2492128.1 hypothetical protein [Aulosira sp. FACHB-615]
MRLLEKKELNLTPIFLMGNAIVLTLLLLIELVNFFGLWRIANSKAPTLVELSDGESIRVSSISSSERSSQAITHFVGQTMTGLLSWNTVPQNELESPLEKLKLDTGVQAGQGRITTKTWATGFALSEDFRAPFLEQLGKLTPPDVFQGSTQSILKVSFLGEPRKLKESRGWTIDLIAELIIFKGGNVIGEPITFNKTIFVKAIDTPRLPKQYSNIQKIAYQARKAGLEIYKIQDFELGEK